MIEANLEEINIIKTFLRYDIPWKGICLYQDKLYHFSAIDKTDYEKMERECPYCSSSEDSGTSAYECNCQSFVDVVYQLKVLTFSQKLKMLFTFSKS